MTQVDVQPSSRRRRSLGRLDLDHRATCDDGDGSSRPCWRSLSLSRSWAYSYNPLDQSWNFQSKGEWGSWVGTSSGVEAHFKDTSTPGSPMGTVSWNEPTGIYAVQFETEIINTGSHAVRIDYVGEPLAMAHSTIECRSIAVPPSHTRTANHSYHAFILSPDTPSALSR